jgi:lysophospholipase L1-like esterase
MIMQNNLPGMRITFGLLGRTLTYWILADLLIGSVHVIFATPAYAQTPIKIMPLGDSITFDDRFGKYSAFDERTANRQPLWQLLSSSGYYVDFAGTRIAGQDVLPAFDPDNEGYSGKRDDEIALIVYDLLIQNRPDVILLHIGTNGVDPSLLDVERILDEVDRYEADYGATVRGFLACIINRGTYDATTTQFNNNVEAMSQRGIVASDDIVIVDMENGAGFDYRLEPLGDMADNLHPNDNGYTKMASKWMEALSFYLSVPSDPAPPMRNAVPSLTTAYVGKPYALTWLPAVAHLSSTSLLTARSI